MKVSPLREAILAGLRRRRPGATLCPSEAARAVYPSDWRKHMEATRREALLLCDEGLVAICQAGERIDPQKGFKGPIRLRLETREPR